MLRAELARRGRERETVSIGAATDPYQPAEGRYRLTRACIEVLRDARNPFHVITRSPMIVRDIDVLAEAAVRAKVSVSFSIPTLDEEVWRKSEPGTPPPRQRFRALRTLVDAGIDAGVMVAPVLPGISDRPEQLRAVVEAAREAGARHLWAGVLHLRPGTREHFLAELARDWPEHLDDYERLYGRRAYLPASETTPVQALVSRLRAESGPARAGRPEPLRPPPSPSSSRCRSADRRGYDPAVTHVLFVWTPNGYSLHERDGEPPAVGSEIEEQDGRFVVTKVAGSPLPGDGRRCAYLQPVR